MELKENKVKKEIENQMSHIAIIQKAYLSVLFLSCMDFLTQKDETALRKRIDKYDKKNKKLEVEK